MISILIPTLNRSDFLIRALYYYSKVGFKGYVCIGDSSDAQHIEKTKRAIYALEGKLRIIYRSFPNPPYTHGGMVIKELIELAPTPYAVFAGDDDFVIPNGLEECAAFLENHPEYSAAHGARIVVSVQSSRAFGRLDSASYVPQPILESETASERWSDYMLLTSSTQYAVHRTETWRRMYRDVARIPDLYLGSELLPCGLSVILGKIKQLNCLTTVFQINDDHVFNWATNSMYSLIVHPEWSLSVQVMRDCIVDALVQRDGIDVDKAQEIFDKAFWYRILYMLQGHYYCAYHEPTIKDFLKKTLKRIPGLVTVVRRLRLITSEPKPTRKYGKLLSLKSPLKPASPFYADFMPVYHAIVREAGNNGWINARGNERKDE